MHKSNVCANVCTNVLRRVSAILWGPIMYSWTPLYSWGGAHLEFCYHHGYRVSHYILPGGSPKSQIPVVKRLCKSSHKRSICAKVTNLTFLIGNKITKVSENVFNIKSFVQILFAKRTETVFVRSI